MIVATARKIAALEYNERRWVGRSRLMVRVSWACAGIGVTGMLFDVLTGSWIIAVITAIVLAYWIWAIRYWTLRLYQWKAWLAETEQLWAEFGATVDGTRRIDSAFLAGMAAGLQHDGGFRPSRPN